MGDPVTATLLIGGAALEATGKIMAGREQARAAEFEARQFEAREQTLRTQAAQAEAQRRDELTSTLETISTIRAGRGVGEASPTSQAFLGDILSDEARDIRTERLNILGEAEQSRTASLLSRRKAKTSLLSSFVDAGSGLLTTAASARQSANRERA